MSIPSQRASHLHHHAAPRDHGDREHPCRSSDCPMRLLDSEHPPIPIPSYEVKVTEKTNLVHHSGPRSHSDIEESPKPHSARRDPHAIPLCESAKEHPPHSVPRGNCDSELYSVPRSNRDSEHPL
ncbi:hypothetical protein ACJJTC_016710 [Scirpophaga incertulas]